MGNEDQTLRKMSDSIRTAELKQFNAGVTETSDAFTLVPDFNRPLSNHDLTALINKKDNAHMISLREIIKKHGWPCVSVYGEKVAAYSFLIIQHASLEEQVKYFPLLELAAKKNEASLEWVALMQDRILVRQGKEQLYGTQARSFNTEKSTLYPIGDFKNVNKRRALMGLGPIEKYVKDNDMLLDKKNSL
jgi:hypothetical protein